MYSNVYILSNNIISPGFNIGKNDYRKKIINRTMLKIEEKCGLIILEKKELLDNFYFRVNYQILKILTAEYFSKTWRELKII